MTRIDLDAFRTALETRQTELRNGNRNRESLTIDASPDELDRIQNSSERDFAMGHLERDSAQLREVRAALGRIDAGTFGVCTVCEEYINPKRLAAVPSASCCIACQEAAERLLKTFPMPFGESLGMAA
jgi:DnaK suppressor protein